MIVEFDPAKDVANQAKHGVSLQLGEAVFADPQHLIVTTVRPQDGEARSKVIGRAHGELRTAVFVRRGEAVRFIGVRRSNDKEARAYSRRP